MNRIMPAFSILQVLPARVALPALPVPQPVQPARVQVLPEPVLPVPLTPRVEPLPVAVPLGALGVGVGVRRVRVRAACRIRTGCGDWRTPAPGSSAPATR